MPKDEVTRFIARFNPEETRYTFTNGCCYWFAKILEQRFDGEICYNPVENHFATKIKRKFYDITGEITDVRDYVSWDCFKMFEPLASGRITRECINF